jgi:hypothetical protein
MATPQESNTIQVYFKIPFTEITTTCNVDCSLTTLEFMNYVNSDIRYNLNIHSRYYIELVDTGKPGGELATCMEPRYDETLLQRYNRMNKVIAFYTRPVHPITREFVRRDNYSD